MQTSIRCLGTSGTGVSASRSTTSFLIDSLIAVDCCENFTQKLLNLGIGKIPLIVLSHIHADHVIGLFMWLWRSYIYEKELKSPIILIPKSSREDLIKITELLSFPGNPKESYFDIRGLGLEDQPFEIDLPNPQTKKPIHYKISWIEAIHYNSTYSYRIEKKEEGLPDRVIVFSSDTRYNPALIDHTQNADILFHESTFFDDMHDALKTTRHACPSQAADIAAKAEVKKLVLVHTPHTFDESKIQNAKKIFENIVIAKDGDEFLV
jgi:ribonuclease Z